MYAELERKVCGICKMDKALNSYFKHKNKKMGVRFECKECNQKEVVKSRLANPEKWKQKRRRSLMAAFGISLDIYNSILYAQGGCCAICKTHYSELPKKLFVDHCHGTKKVRGLLCQKCNFFIGLAKDSRKILLAAVDYLDKFKN